MIEAVCSVCGDEQYFEMSRISIPSFLKANPDTRLNVFTDQVGRIPASVNCRVWDYGMRLEALRWEREEDVERVISRIENHHPTFDNNGVMHHHSYVALLPLLAEHACSQAEWLLKIDVDSYFVENMMRGVWYDHMVDGWDIQNGGVKMTRIGPSHDLWLVSRTRGDIMKLFAGVPGVGFCLWRRGGTFVDKYVEAFDGNEQNTILRISGYQAGQKMTDYTGLIKREECHICYPFYQAEINGHELTKEIIDEWVPCYLHIRGPGQVEKMQKLEEWYK